MCSLCFNSSAYHFDHFVEDKADCQSKDACSRSGGAEVYRPLHS